MANPPKLYVPVPTPVVDPERRITRDWVLLFDQIVARLFASGTVVGPASSVDNAITLFSGTSGQVLKAATGTGVVHATSGVYSAADVTYAELTAATAASRLLGRGSAAGAGDWQELTVGTGTTITGTVVTAKPDDVVLRGTRAAQPAASAVLAGTLYGVTDEDNLLERSNGTTWDVYTETGPAGPTGPTGPTGPAGANGRSANTWPYIARTGATSGDPGDGKILWNNATQTSATAILIDDLNDETPTFDISVFLSLCENGMRFVVQDRNDATQWQRFLITGASTDLGGYWSIPVSLINSGGSAFINNEQIEIALVWASPSDSNEALVLSTATGTQTAWAPGLYGDTAVQWSGASDLTIQGIAGGSSGQLFRFKNTGSKWAWWTHASGSASASDRLTNLVTSNLTPVAPGGWIQYQHDGTNWQLVGHEQGAWITPTYSAGNFTANGSMTWTVDAGDITTLAYYLKGRTLTVSINLGTTSVGGTVSTALQIGNGAWGSYSTAKSLQVWANYTDSGAASRAGQILIGTAIGASSTQLWMMKDPIANWTLATNSTYVAGQITFEVT